MNRKKAFLIIIVTFLITSLLLATLQPGLIREIFTSSSLIDAKCEGGIFNLNGCTSLTTISAEIISSLTVVDCPKLENLSVSVSIMSDIAEIKLDNCLSLTHCYFRDCR